MHELGITRNIVAIVADAAQGRPVRGVTLAIGRLSGVVPDAIRFCFDVVTTGTVLEGARLDIHEIEGRARCRACRAEFPMVSFVTACACGSRRLEAIAGEELIIKTMELEEVA
jgi:hydrogenase nickel incorporation protein HypA/HybF